MTTLTIFLAGFSLATFAWGIFYALILLHRPRYTAPTMRRKWRDAPGTEFMHVPPTVQWEAKATDDGCGIEYRFMGATGLEE
jgi:hypothetical protein